MFRGLVKGRHEKNLEGLRKEKGDELNLSEKATVWRQAVAWALAEFGILSIRAHPWYY